MNVQQIQGFQPDVHWRLPLYETRIAAGFPSPADDFADIKLDLNEYLVKHPASTFFVRVSGDSMTGAGIFDGDILIVDRSLQVKNNDVIIAALEGELTVKRFCQKDEQVMLKPENIEYDPIVIEDEAEFSVWGVVTAVIHKV